MTAPLGAVAVAGVRRMVGRRGGAGRQRLGPLGVGSAVVIAILVLVAIFAPLLAPHDPEFPNIDNVLRPPSAEHPFGTDGSGYDLLSRLVFGARTSLIGPLVIIACATAAATLLALLGAWRGGAVDVVIARAFDVVLAFPGILLAILAVAVFEHGLAPAVVALAISYTPYIGRVLRAVALRERNLPYVDALSSLGFGAFTICVRHVGRNLVPTIMAQATVSFGYALVDLAALSYLGLGVQLPRADWGLMVATGQADALQGFPEESLSACVLLVLTVVAFTVLGERLVGRSEERAR